MLAYDFPLLSLFWISLWWFFLLSVLFGVIWSFIDNFRRHDHGGWAKAGWAFLILILPSSACSSISSRVRSTWPRSCESHHRGLVL